MRRSLCPRLHFCDGSPRLGCTSATARRDGGHWKWDQPRGPSYVAPSTVTTAPASPGSLADPMVREALGEVGAGGERRDDRVVVAATEDELHRVDPQRGTDGLHRLGELERVGGDVDRHTGGSGDVPGIGDQPVGDVDHRGRTCVRGGQPGGVRRFRTLVGLDERARGAEPASQDGQPRGGPTLPARDRDDVPRLRSAAEHRRHLAGAHHRDRDHDLLGSGQVTPDDAGPDESGLLGDAVGEVQRPLHGQVRRGSQADGQRVRGAAHRVDVGQVGRSRLAADVPGLGPLPPEVPALDEQVGGHDHVTLGRAQERRIITGSDEHLRTLMEPARELGNQAELPHIGKRGVLCERVRCRHGAIPPDSRWPTPGGIVFHPGW